MNSILLQTPSERPQARTLQSARKVPTFGEIGTGYRPGGSFGLSVIFHQLALLLILISSSRFVLVQAAEVVPPKLEPVKIDGTLYLPTLGGGSEGAGTKGGGSGADKQASTGLRARSRRGFAYPGPQPLVSAPPLAKLGIQTILQPNLENPLLLEKTYPLPNLAIAATAPAAPPKPVMKVQSGRMAIRPAESLVQAPKLALPVATSSRMPDLAATQGPMPQAPPPKPVPAPAKTSDVPMDSRGQQGLLVLNAIPPPPDVTLKVPRGEARSLFAVAPGEATIIAEPASGVRGAGTASNAAGSGSKSDNASGDAIADAPSGGGSGMGTGGSGIGTGSHYGTGTGSGLNPGTEGASSGRGTASGAGTGTGSGTVLGSGNGSGSAPGNGGFPGISIRGGNYGNGSGGIRPNIVHSTQTSYAMTITSTSNSGGGLPDFGVFQNQKVYTVYLDMRTNDQDHAPSWTMEYALLQPTSTDPTERVKGTPTAPYATLKEVPEVTPDLAVRYAHKLIIASAILNIAGKLEQISIKQSPDPQIIRTLVESLKNWTFQPSAIDGKPVALRILLGIRLAR